jgi:hypothetical protein
MRNAGRLRLALLSLLVVIGVAAIAAPGAGARAGLDMYRTTVDGATLADLRARGYDIASVKSDGAKLRVDLVLSARERADLSGRDLSVRLLRDRQGRTVAQRARAQARGGFTVYRDYDGPDGIRAELYRFARRHRSIARLHVIGHTLEGREIIAIELTQGSRGHGKHAKPAVLYQGTTHAREWISTEVTRRLMYWFADRSSTDKSVKKLLKTRDLWFVPVVNPDGYQYTFDSERLWRKNLRDNNGDGQITLGDGVDINRNYPEHWNYDDEGSKTVTTADDYRGTAAASEPETRVSIRLLDRVHFAYAVSYHSYAALILYPEGWQVQTPTRDDPVYIALSGTDEDPAIEGFDPDLSAELYTTNGEFTDWAHSLKDTLSWTVELDEGCPGCGFVFPDDEAQVEDEFEKNVPFALDLAKSADDPDDPDSHLGTETEPFYLETVSADPTRAGNPGSDFRFNVSYGDPQPVEVLAKRSLGNVRVHYRINGGAEQTAPTSEWDGGERYGRSYSTYYHELRGEVTGTSAGDEVEVWFESRDGRRSDSFTYRVETASGAEVLIVSAEDYTGVSNQPGGSTTGPGYLSYFEDALSANGIGYDVYDVDVHGRTAPDALGVLGHYDAVVWYTGDDIVTREPGMVAGTASRLANDEMLEMRSYLNEGGKLLYNGQYAGFQYAGGYAFDPVANAPCGAGDPAVDARCQALSDDFLQYYLGAYLYEDSGGSDPDTGEPLPIEGTQDPYGGLGWDLNGADSAGNQAHTAAFLTTSSLLPEAQYPQFASSAPAAWVRSFANAFEPYDGDQYAYSDRADVSYKRLTRTIDLAGLSPGDPASLGFRFSYDTEPGWDFAFVEAHVVGSDEWTTLPDLMGHTSDDTGDSCPEGWHELHPFLEHYQTLNEDGTCSASGTTGAWNAASGRSQGWEPWQVDLGDYAGEQVEVSISYASDWGTQGIGAFVDAIDVSTGEGSTSFEDDDDVMDGWQIPGSPEGSGPNANDWEATRSVDFQEGAVTATPDSLYFGFGLEGVTGAETRAQVMGRSIEYLTGGP